MNKEELRKKCYEIGNSQFPIDVFYNDIRDNKAPNFNKEEAFKDLEKIVNYIESLKKKNQMLKSAFKLLKDLFFIELNEEIEEDIYSIAIFKVNDKQEIISYIGKDITKDNFRLLEGAFKQ